MWKTFIMIFAIPITWDFLDQIDKSILAYFVRACKILTSRELQKNELDEVFTKLVEINKLVEEKYGQEKISLNLHLCLHIRIPQTIRQIESDSDLNSDSIQI